MAQTTQNTSVLSDTSDKAVTEKVLQSPGGLDQAKQLPDDEHSSAVDKPPAAAPSRPSLVPLGSNHSQPAVPHPKKFSAVNINKKFLEKNSSASASSASASASSIAKSGSPTSRPAISANTSHSRLVTTKLTAAPAVSTAGWSRPSSVVPSPSTSANSPSNTPLLSAGSTQPSTAAPQLPHAGKVIQPQPRTALVSPLSSQKDASGSKPVWGNVKPPSAPSTRLEIPLNDFPTAAEVANVARKAKAEDGKAAVDSAAKQARMEEADTFRGVHLDPNAHHWDEMEEDDDNFLSGVIEFGDGRQYKVEVNEAQATSSSPPRKSRPEGDTAPSGPVNKEDRFVDDFDRSWPPSLLTDVPPTSTHSGSPTISPAVSHPAYSPQDSSRVLFNERSNRLEPYSQSHRGPSSFNKRTNHQEGPGVQPEFKGPKEGQSNVQVLQKGYGNNNSNNDFNSRRRRFSGSNSGFGQGPSNDRPRESVPPRRDGLPSTSPRIQRNAELERDTFPDRGRRGVMGPPPVPPQKYAQDNGGDARGRQQPPHLSPTIPQRRPFSRDSRVSDTSPSTQLPSTSARMPSTSPRSTTQLLVSPSGGPPVALPLNGVDLEEVRKDVMQSAAARAKARRQQEEAEREAQKERARRKAAELEERMNAAEAEKAKMREEEERARKALEQEAVKILESVIESPTMTNAETQTDPLPGKVPLRRPPSLKGLSSQGSPGQVQRVGPVPPRSAPIITPSNATQSDSWRAKANPPPPIANRQPERRPSVTAAPTLIMSTPSALEQIETIAGSVTEELEVVDFTDMDKFVGGPGKKPDAGEKEKLPGEVKPGVVGPPPAEGVRRRPVASDFFDEPVSSEKQREFNMWRRKVSQDDTQVGSSKPEVKVVENAERPSIAEVKETPNNVADTSLDVKESLHLERVTEQTVHVPPQLNVQKSPRNQGFYKEATMSALDDAMLRIKGAISGMHAQDVSLEHPPSSNGQQHAPFRPIVNQLPVTPSRSTFRERWVPPALRSRPYVYGDEPREVFLVTVSELSSPTSPEIPLVKFPSISRAVGMVNKRQLHIFMKAPQQPRWDIMTFDPPVHGMDRRSLSVNDVLFRRPPTTGYKNIRYRVVLPRHKGPRVHMPSQNTIAKHPSSTTSFPRTTPADGATSWRNTTPRTPAGVKAEVGQEMLDTTSGSPLPESGSPKRTVASIPKSSEGSPAKSDGATTKGRGQPKMPAGSAVAFYRDARGEVDAKPSVNFIVGSELEDRKGGDEDEDGKGEDAAVPALEATISESKSSEETEPTPITPPLPRNSSWTRASVNLPLKESPSRGPDPEHLKALWSQKQNATKSVLHPVNSLEGIADDLTALPFTLQDVKSEDGETPPPSIPTAPSRMSLHDVTKAFQQVPASSSSSSTNNNSNSNNQTPQRNVVSPPSTSAPAQPRPPYGYSPLPQSNMRLPYGSYPSPMMSHSPSPMMYPHPMASSPVPSRMQPNGHNTMPPLYGQQVWIHTASPMRPPGSPYPAQMMAYPAGPYPPPPPQPAPGGGMQVPNGSPAQNGGRGRTMPLMSPIMGHAHAHPGAAAAMYGGSPVMMHAMQVPGYGPPPLPMQGGRGGQPMMRVESGAAGGQGQQQGMGASAGQPLHIPHAHLPSQNGHLQQSHPGFNPAASPYVRTGW